ncbi:FAD-binding oxidoreductase [Algicola sagamiensis]|uniref:FAD-binding oxidoreductase n=1 Tax=Algicola sagamiensis TaxID=163869 RepID=UPI000367B0DF|nr:FAD-binding oxidoreductase [Algicola sagamiensis]
MKIPYISIILFLLSNTYFAVAETWNDVSRLNQTKVAKIVEAKTESDLLLAIEYARQHKKQISISGTQHSQGGHIATLDGVVLDMRSFNQIMNISAKDKTIQVQSGVTWDHIQKVINPLGLSVKVMQSSNIFSIGGSISANVHGRDPSYGPLVDTILSLKVLLSDGRILQASRTTNSELFRAIIGGYGALGIILEAKIALTDNVLLKKTVHAVKYDEYWQQLKQDLAKGLSLHFGRCSFVQGKHFLDDCFQINYTVADAKRYTNPLHQESHIQRNRTFFHFSRQSNLGKHLRWSLQKSIIDPAGKTSFISRNNAMRPPIQFLAYNSLKDTDILQEYFVPVEAFASYLDDMRTILRHHHVNLLSMTIRYVKADEVTLLPYATKEMLAIVIYVNQSLDKTAIDTARQWTQQLVQSALKHQGTYYLTYQRYPTLSQFYQAYPQWQQWKKMKEKYDPSGLWMNQFYQHYFSVPVKSEK